MFVTVKSEYNYLKSLNKINQIIPQIKEKFNYIAIADNDSIINSLEIINLCQKNNLKPIIGFEHLTDDFYGYKSIFFYAKNKNGYQLINQLLSEKIFTNKKIVDILEEYNEQFKNDIVIVFNQKETTKKLPNISSLIQQLNKLKITNYYFSFENKLKNIDLNNYQTNLEEGIYLLFIDKIIDLYVPLYPHNDDLNTYLVLQAINNKTKYEIEKKRKLMYQPYSLEYILSLNTKDENILNSTNSSKYNETTESFINLFENYKVETTYSEILDFKEFNNINFENLLETKLEEYLNNLTKKINSNKIYDLNKNKRTSFNKDDYYQRLSLELKTIKDMQFENYFLIMHDIVNFCADNDILYGDGRGSAPGSLVSFLLKITKIDPIEYGLYFERFLNPERITVPDIDLDIADDKRNLVIDYLLNKYGEEHVAKILTINKFLAKSIVNDIGKALDIDAKTLKKITAKLNSRISFEDNIKENYNFFSPYLKDPKFDFLRENVNKLEYMPRNSSIHAAGIVISSPSIYKRTNILENVVQDEAKYLEETGFIKFDLLSLTTLSFLENLKADINEIRLLKGKSKFELTDIPLNDPRVFANLSNGNTFGVFQLESPGMINLIKRYKPETITDLGIILALYRPGPMKYIDTFIEYRKDPQKVSYIHPKMEEILSQTYGIMIFQEDVMNVVRHIAGFNAKEADLFRYAVSKQKHEEIEKQQDKFLDGGINLGLEEPTLEKIFEDIEEFSGYGFNKAHAIAYASLIYKILYIKTYMPAVFYSQIFKSSINSDRKDLFISEIAAHNVKLYGPNIIKSNLENRLNGKNILLGLENIKGVSSLKLKKMLEYREVYLENNKENINLSNFLQDVFYANGIDFTEVEIKTIIASGAFDSFGFNIKTLEETVLHYASNINLLKITGEDIEVKQIEDYNFEEKNILELKALNFNLKYSKKELLVKKFKSLYPKANLYENIYDLSEIPAYQNVFVYARYIRKKEIRTKKDEPMAFYTFDINLNECEATCFPQSYAKINKEIANGSEVIILIKRDKENKFIVEQIIS